MQNIYEFDWNSHPYIDSALNLCFGKALKFNWIPNTMKYTHKIQL